MANKKNRVPGDDHGTQDEAPTLRAVSKSARKREADQVDVLAKELLNLSVDQWEHIPMSDAMRASLEEAHRLKRKGGVRGGLRRQMLHLSGVLRTEDMEAILDATGRNATPSDRERALMKVERWRSEIIARGDAGIQDFLATYPDASRQRLRQLAMQAAREAKKEQPPKGARQLFAYLREVVGV